MLGLCMEEKLGVLYVIEMMGKMDMQGLQVGLHTGRRKESHGRCAGIEEGARLCGYSVEVVRGEMKLG